MIIHQFRTKHSYIHLKINQNWLFYNATFLSSSTQQKPHRNTHRHQKRPSSDQETLRQHHPFTLLTKILYKLSVSSFLLRWISCYHSYKLTTMTKVAKLWYFVQKNYHGKFIEFVWLGPIQLLQRNKKKEIWLRTFVNMHLPTNSTLLFSKDRKSQWKINGPLARLLCVKLNINLKCQSES